MGCSRCGSGKDGSGFNDGDEKRPVRRLAVGMILDSFKAFVARFGFSATSVAGLVVRKKSVALAGRRSFSPFDTSHTATDRRVLAFAGR